MKGTNQYIKYDTDLVCCTGVMGILLKHECFISKKNVPFIEIYRTCFKFSLQILHRTAFSQTRSN